MDRYTRPVQCVCFSRMKVLDWRCIVRFLLCSMLVLASTGLTASTQLFSPGFELKKIAASRMLGGGGVPPVVEPPAEEVYQDACCRTDETCLTSVSPCYGRNAITCKDSGWYPHAAPNLLRCKVDSITWAPFTCTETWASDYCAESYSCVWDPLLSCINSGNPTTYDVPSTCDDNCPGT